MSGSSASTPHAPTDGRHGTCPVRCSRNTGSAAPVASQRVLDEARLLEAPVTVALHRYVEGIIAVSREWPLDGMGWAGASLTCERGLPTGWSWPVEPQDVGGPSEVSAYECRVGCACTISGRVWVGPGNR
jgi:hypothetical protein